MEYKPLIARLGRPSIRRISCVSLVAAFSACSKPQTEAINSPLPVATQAATLNSFTSPVALTGEIRAQIETELGFRFAGRIVSRTVDVGDHVAAGQILASLDAPQQMADITAATANVRAAEADVAKAQLTFDRQNELLVNRFTTQSSVDNARSQLQTARSALESAGQRLLTAQDQFANTDLRADAPGIITARNAEAGQVVDAAQTIFGLAKDGQRDAVFMVNESLLTSPVPPRNAINITLLSNREVTATGSVREVAPAVDPETGTVRVKIGLTETPPAMKLGAPVVGSAQFRQRDVFALPWTAFFVDEGNPAVWVVDPSTSTVSLKPVVVDSFRTGLLLLRSGLDPGDIVVVAGVQLLYPGRRVAIRTLAKSVGQKS